jgi:hypothetical protein
MKNNTWERALSLAILAALLIAGAHTALAAKGGKRATDTILFDDYVADTIQSDSLGPYDGVHKRDGSFIFATGDRSMFFDFSLSLVWWSFAPFGDGEIEDVTMTVDTLTETSAIVEFEFIGPDPEGRGTTDWLLTMSVSVSQTNDSYVLESSGDALLWYVYRTQSTGRGVEHRYGPTWERAGIFEMPWGAEVSR